MTKILVAYASKYGATAEIASTIGEVLQEGGMDVKVVAAGSVKDLESYDAVVLGSAVYAGNWIAAASDFVKTNEAALTKKPVWVFSSGPTGEGDPEEILGGWSVPNEIEAEMDRINPKDMRLFHGKIDMEKLNWGERLLIKAMKGETGDSRDWVAIKTWANGILDTLKS